LELINVISMILFPHDLLTPDADRTPCTPSLPRDRIKGMFIFHCKHKHLWNADIMPR